MTLQTTLDVRYTIPFQEAVEYFENRHLLPHPTILPAWSLHRLIEMCPLIPSPPRFLAVTSFKTVYVRMNDEMDVCYASKGTYNNLINCIEWLIKEGCFNKEYLEE